MNKIELENLLISKGVPKQYYALKGGLPNEAYTLNKDENKWEVYYSERGNKSGLQMFDSEEAACDYFYKLINTDGVMKKYL